jgi:hypothetical protein
MVIGKEHLGAVCTAPYLEHRLIAELAAVGDAQELA